MKIDNIEEAVDKLKRVMIEICNISFQIEWLVGPTFQKSEALTSLLASLGVLKNMVSDPTLLHDLRRRIKQ